MLLIKEKVKKKEEKTLTNEFWIGIVKNIYEYDDTYILRIKNYNIIEKLMCAN